MEHLIGTAATNGNVVIWNIIGGDAKKQGCFFFNILFFLI